MVCEVEVTKIQLFRLRAHWRVEGLAAGGMGRHHTKRGARFIEGPKNASALGSSIDCQGVGMFRVGDAFVDFLRMCHPVTELVDGWTIVSE